ncbi:putative aquaporin TIP5-1 [Camellia lanceoleosa]|uniref:Aquaporin TIP5-1 n=1 Tax=Camellia lanceoleosa TaxID=1840588 RepID=A0ACC0GIN4_9ERIC|nr:putative aquaporin TIP5-1 [Camellia lanceoleosa]
MIVLVLNCCYNKSNLVLFAIAELISHVFFLISCNGVANFPPRACDEAQRSPIIPRRFHLHLPLHLCHSSLRHVSRKTMSDAAIDLSALVAITVANAFALSVAVYAAANISSNHVNPAVTFGMAVSDNISVPMAIFYWISQLVGSVMACLFLKVTTVTQHVHVHGIPQ